MPGVARKGFEMPQKRYTAEQIIPMLRRADVELGHGKTIPEVCKLLEISEQTYYRWRQKYGSMQPETTGRNLRLCRKKTHG